LIAPDLHCAALVIPAKAGIQRFYEARRELDPGFRRDDKKKDYA